MAEPRAPRSSPVEGSQASRPADASPSASARPTLRRAQSAPAPGVPAPKAAPRQASGTRSVPNSSPPAQPANAPAPPREGTRLNKRLAELGLCSRREADEWIARGWVVVNGAVAQMGVRVVPTDRVTVERAAQREQAERVTILLNKPMGYVSGQAEDGHEPAVVLVTPRSHWQGDSSGRRFSPPQLRGLAPAGRLDIDSVGLLVLTQDGRVARQLIGEDSSVDKEYLVRVVYEGDTPDLAARTGERAAPLLEIHENDPVRTNVQAVFPPEQLQRLRHGLSLDGKPLLPAKVEWQNPEQLRFVLVEGKKRQIRRMCEQVGLKVVGLKRIRIGGVVLGNLPLGQWRYLGPDERF
ncbi:MAG: RNA-binding protein [Giesbergeria sp.]|jgi:23S rRNA pseudouridine2604 synthase|nr:RNA-binding protein [Giesbergeria sp.]